MHADDVSLIQKKLSMIEWCENAGATDTGCRMSAVAPSTSEIPMPFVSAVSAGWSYRHQAPVPTVEPTKLVLQPMDYLGFGHRISCTFGCRIGHASWKCEQSIALPVSHRRNLRRGITN